MTVDVIDQEAREIIVTTEIIDLIVEKILEIKGLQEDLREVIIKDDIDLDHQKIKMEKIRDTVGMMREIVRSIEEIIVILKGGIIMKIKRKESMENLLHHLKALRCRLLRRLMSQMVKNEKF